jgi:Cellulose binding domain
MARVRRAALAVMGACGLLLLIQLPASAIDVSGTPSPVTGNATWFSGLGSPYGGCGLPQANLDSQNFLALNVQNSPGDYTNLPRPIPAADASMIGMFDNGLNCGRWVRVTIGNYCTGINDGAPNQPFCRGGSWVADSYNGATLDMIVADSCDDGNAWCKDDPYHVDLAQASLNQFVKNGQPVGDMYPNHWNNRQVSWQFIPAPSYTGDISIGAIQGAQPYWPAIAVSHLPNGIHGVQYYAGGTWHSAQMDSDMGDDYIIAPTVPPTVPGTGGNQFEIQVLDATDTLINDGRVYSFSLPAGCATGCGPAYTPISYTTSTGPSPPPSPTPQPTGACAAVFSVTNSWSGGYQAQVTVTNNGAAPTTGWTTSFTLPGAQTIASSWNAVVSETGQQVSAGNQSYNGSIAAGGSATWGLVVNTGGGEAQPPSGATCSAA